MIMTALYKQKVTLLLFVLLVLTPIFTYCGAQEQNAGLPLRPSLVIYVPGWKNKGVPQEEQLKMLYEIYPYSKVVVKLWDSDGDFETCKNRADAYVEALASEICAMPQKDYSNMVLIGHSLGGRIAVKTIAALQSRKIHIRKGIFLGAAIPDNAPEIEAAINSTREPCINIHNRDDYVLRHVYSIFGDGLTDALGAYGYSKIFYGVHMLQYEIKFSASCDEYIEKMKNHNVGQYLAKLSEVEKSFQMYRSVEKKFPLTTILPSVTWSVLGECCNWKIKIQKMTSSCCIENPFGDVVFWGDKDAALACWKLLSTKYTKTAQETIDKIQVLQDKKNPVIKVVPLGWENVDEINGWRLQRKEVLLRGMVYRIIDPKDFQRANGDEQKMYKSFEYIKKQMSK